MVAYTVELSGNPERSIKWIRYNHGLKTLKQRLAQRGMVTTGELCRRLGLHREAVRNWRRAGCLIGRVCNTKGEWMYEPPDLDSLPTKRRRSGNTITEAAGGAV